jgi:hypothetical protein
VAAGFPDEGVRNTLSARDFIQQFYGVLATTKPKETVYTVGTTVTVIGTNYGQRLAFLISNTGLVNVAVGFNPDISITQGVLLTQGGAFGSNWYFDLELVGRQVYAVAASSGATIYMVENILSGA